MPEQKVINVLFGILIFLGLLTGLMHSINLELTSDTVAPGIVAMEIVNYHDFQYIFPVNDPYLFTDIFTFHFLPQVLSNYDPTVLRLTAFVVFLLIVAVFSYLIYRYSSLTNSLIFAALLTNLSPEIYPLFLSPNYHIGTLLFAGIFLLLFSVDIIKNQKVPVLAALTFIVGLIVISDNIIIAFFVLPYIAYCVYQYRLKGGNGEKVKGKKAQDDVKASEVSHFDIIVLLLVIFTVFAYLLKRNNFFLGLHTFLLTPISFASVSDVGGNIALFFNALFLLVNNGLYNLLNRGITALDLLFAVAFITVIAYSIISLNKKAGYLYWIFLVSAIITFLGFVFTNLAVDIGSYRFLVFIAVSIFAVIALAYKPERMGVNPNTFFLAGIILLVLAALAMNAVTISGYDNQPNKEDLGLVKFLQENNLTSGYADYENANKIIYFSKGQLLYPKITVSDTQFESDGMGSSIRWYDQVYRDGHFYLIIHPDDSNYEGELRFRLTHNPSETHDYLLYSVYRYELSPTFRDVHAGADG